MGWRLVKTMTKCFFSEPGCRKYWGGNLAPPWSFPNLFGPLESLRCLLFEFAWSC